MPSLLPKIQKAMLEPGFYPHPTSRFERFETHISVVVLTGDYVYKVKKAVDLGFLDFSTLERRRDACNQECNLNRRLSRDIYLDVIPITMDKGKFRLGGEGSIVEYAVLMRQLPADRTLDRLLRAGKIGGREMKQLAAVLEQFYRSAATGTRIDAFGGRDAVRNNCEENFRQTAEFAGRYIDRRYFDIVQAATCAFIDKGAHVFEKRVSLKKIRDCHGDLKCEHIYFTRRCIQIIDCIEFNDRFRFGDTAGDLAFLLMGLDFQGHKHIARMLLDAYVRRSNDLDIYNVLTFYKCYRAMVQVKVHCLRLQQLHPDAGMDSSFTKTAQRYMQFAYRYALAFGRPKIWVVCGPIAAGKSTVAKALSEVLGISVLRTDQIRKELFKNTTKSTESTGPTAFEEGAYSPEATALTYGELFNRTEAALKEGLSIILDATFSLETQRNEVCRLAGSHQVAAYFIVCECRETVIRQRLAARSGLTCVSDARLRHWEDFKRRFEDVEEVTDRQILRIDTEQPAAENLKVVLNRFADA